MMSYLEELIEKLCPNGVEYKTLGEVLEYEQPTKYIVKSTKYDNSHCIPVLTAGQSFVLGYTNEEFGIKKANKTKSVIIFDDFTTSFHWVDFDFKIKSSAMKILHNKNREKTNFRYIYFAMKSIKYFTLEHSRQWIGKYSKIKIPVPPIEVQSEIVRILDNFTELTAELTAELEARKKQYEHYRDTLLTFDKNDPTIQWKTLGEAFTIKNGYTPSKKIPEYWDNGTVPWFRMEDIRKNGNILNDSIQHVTNKGIKKDLFPKNSIILATSATIGEHALIKCEYLSNQRFTCFVPKMKFDIKFLYYYFYIIDEWCFKNVIKGNFLGVDIKKLIKYKIPIPPMEEQERIVAILDRFDSLCNDITKGLPAEIEARKKQYEHYRDKLLTFKELETPKENLQ